MGPVTTLGPMGPGTTRVDRKLQKKVSNFLRYGSAAELPAKCKRAIQYRGHGVGEVAVMEGQVREPGLESPANWGQKKANKRKPFCQKMTILGSCPSSQILFFRLVIFLKVNWLYS
mgnify:CR=1 FL=1